MLFKESHYGAKAPQNMMYKEQNKIKNTILFQNYHPFKFFWKKYPFYNFCWIFAILDQFLTLMQKFKFIKWIYDLDDSLAWKYIV